MFFYLSNYNIAVLLHQIIFKSIVNVITCRRTVNSQERFKWYEVIISWTIFQYFQSISMVSHRILEKTNITHCCFLVHISHLWFLGLDCKFRRLFKLCIEKWHLCVTKILRYYFILAGYNVQIQCQIRILTTQNKDVRSTRVC